MEPLETRVKIAILFIAVLCTAALGFLATGGMHWIFAYFGSLDFDKPHPELRIIGAVVIAFVVILRFYVRYRAKQARRKK